MRTILITGGAGFIGSNLADYLISKEFRIINVDNLNDYYASSIKQENIRACLNSPFYKFYKVDITNYKDFENVFHENKIDFVIHLAARAGVRPSIENPILYQNDNCLGTANLLELAKKYGVTKLILASSSSVYGNNQKVPFSENDIVDFAISPYAATKKANEVLAHVYHHIYKMDIIVFRFFTVFGPRQRPDLAISKFTSLIFQNKSLPIFGEGNSSRDYTFVNDIVSGIEKGLLFLEHHSDVFEIINLGSKKPISLLEMVNVIERATGKKASLEFLPTQTGDVEKTYADISKAEKLLGYSPQTSFEEGVSLFVSWYKKNQEKKENNL